MIEARFEVTVALNILIIDDEPVFRDLITRKLTGEGFQTLSLPNANNLCQSMSDFSADVLIVDFEMPGTSGAEVVRAMRAIGPKTDIPILFLSGHSQWETKIQAYEAGADDYICKDAPMEEVVMRVRALARRIPQATKGLQFIKDALKVTYDGQDLGLTRSEYLLLHTMATKSGKVVSREDLAHSISSGSFVSPRTVDVHMAALRRKMAPWPGKINSIRGVGFVLVGPK